MLVDPVLPKKYFGDSNFGVDSGVTTTLDGSKQRLFFVTVPVNLENLRSNEAELMQSVYKQNIGDSPIQKSIL